MAEGYEQIYVEPFKSGDSVSLDYYHYPGFTDDSSRVYVLIPMSRRVVSSSCSANITGTIYLRCGTLITTSLNEVKSVGIQNGNILLTLTTTANNLPQNTPLFAAFASITLTFA